MNLAQINRYIIFIITIITLNSEELNNSNISIPLSYYVIPVHYNINLTHYNINEDLLWAELFNISNDHDFILKGEIKIILNILQTTKSIKLHQLNLKISRNENILITRNQIYVLDKHKYNYETNIIEFALSNILFPGLYTFKIKFYNSLKENHEQSFFKRFAKGNSTACLIAPHIQANGIRQLFPCIDEPHLKATFAISVKHSLKFVTLSNMPVLNYYPCNDEVWTQFFTTPPMSTFQVAIVVTNYQHVDITENIALWYERDSEILQQSLKFEFAKRIIENITLHLKSEFNEINIPKMDHIAIPNCPQDSISKWGLIFHTKADLIYDEHLDPGIRKIEVARLIAPKIAYQWFGVISQSLSHFWIHESLAILYGEEAIAKNFNNSEIMNFFIVQNQYESLHLDSHYDINPVKIKNLTEIDTIFRFPRYMKGLNVLRMLQKEITEKEFQKHVHTYLYRNSYSSNISYPFWFILELMSKEDVPYHIFNDFLNWIEYKHYPIVLWIQNTINNATISQYSNTESDKYGKWLIKIDIVFKHMSSLNISKRVFWLSSKRPVINIYLDNMDDWLSVIITQAGYYRVNYPLENLHKIANYLNSIHGEHNISVINRAKIVDDIFYLVMERQLDVSIFWKVAHYLSQETDYVAWYPMIKVLEYTSTIFPLSVDEIDFTVIMEVFRNLLDQPLRKLGYEDHLMENELTTYLRYEIVKWACILKHFECVAKITYKLLEHLENPEKYPLLPEWKRWTYCQGLTKVAYSTWSILKNKWLEARDPKLTFLVCSEQFIWDYIYNYNSTNSSFLKSFTQYERHDITFIRSYINMFHLIIRKHANKYFTIEKILEVFHNIKPEEISTLTALTDIINYVYSTHILAKISQQVKLMKDIEELQLTQIQYKIQTRSSEIRRHINHFQFMNGSFNFKYV